MKIKTMIPFFVCVFTAFGFCASVHSEQPAAQANGKFDLVLNLKKNDSFSQDCFMNMEVSSAMPDGKKVSSKIKTNFTVNDEVLDVDAEKNIRIRSTLTQIESHMECFDGSNQAKIVPPQINALFVMKDHPIEYIQEATGKIKDIKGFDELAKKIEEKDVRETVEKTFYQLCENAAILPPRAVSLGDSWDLIKELNGLQVKSTYTLTAITDDCFEFDMALQFLPTSDKVKMTGSGKGKVRLDRISNRVKNSMVEAKVITTVLTENAPLNMEFTLSSGLTSTAKTG